MPLQPVPTAPTTAAELIAQRTVNDVYQLANRIVALRKNGIPAQAEQPAREGPNGQPIAARPATPAVTPEMIDAALGADNCALFDTIAEAIGV